MSDVTRLLDAAAAGDRQAAADLLPLVYDELRKLAAARIASENAGHTLDATALVNEAYLRLVGDQQFDGRGHFFAAAAEAMRRILVDSARRKTSVRHGGGFQRAGVDELQRFTDSPDGLIDLNDALDRFAADEPRKAKLVELRFFTGLSVAEAATVLGVSPATAARWWEFARLWLFTDLRELLQKAVKAGYKDAAHMKNDANFESLRKREDFQNSVADLEAKFQPKKDAPSPLKPKK